MAVHVAQQPAIAAAAFGHEDPGREDRGRVELHRLHVAERRLPGLHRDHVADSLGDDGVCGVAIDAPRAARGDRSGLGHIGAQLAGDEVAHHGAVAAPAVVDQRQCFRALVHWD